MVCTHSTPQGEPVLHGPETSFPLPGVYHPKPRGSTHTSAVQSGPESSESETSEYSEVLFLSSDFTLVKIPEKEFKKRKDKKQSFKLWGKLKKMISNLTVSRCLSISPQYLSFLTVFISQSFSL